MNLSSIFHDFKHLEQSHRGDNSSSEIQQHELRSKNVTAWCSVDSNGAVSPYYFNYGIWTGVNFYQILDAYVWSGAQQFHTKFCSSTIWSFFSHYTPRLSPFLCNVSEFMDWKIKSNMLASKIIQISLTGPFLLGIGGRWGISEICACHIATWTKINERNQNWQSGNS